MESLPSIPNQLQGRIPTEECGKFRMMTEIVTGCVSSHFVYCEVEAQPTIMDSYRVNWIPADPPAPAQVQIPQDDPCTEPRLDLTTDISEVEPVFGHSWFWLNSSLILLP